MVSHILTLFDPEPQFGQDIVYHIFNRSGFNPIVRGSICHGLNRFCPDALVISK